MKIALTGYGKMGHEIENLICESGNHQVVSISYKTLTESLDKDGIKKADVVIDFTSPEVIINTIKEITGMGKNMVVGTTGWYEKMDEVKKIVKKAKTGFIYGSNFSIGANIFFQIVNFASKLFSRYGSYDVAGYEIHHTAKKDSPSGTAKKIASLILENFPKRKELNFASLRVGRFFGYHEVIFDSQADEIKLSHNAHSRRGFAEGAIAAAEFIKGKKGFYSFDEVMSEASHPERAISESKDLYK